MAKWNVKKQSLQDHKLVKEKQSSIKLIASLSINIIMLIAIAYIFIKGF